MNEVKILPWLGFNQVQAMHFGLSLNEAIVMNYISSVLCMGEWADTKVINDRVFYRCHSSKILMDMPVLDVTRKTLVGYVNSLIKLGLIEREIIARTTPYFRVTDKWIYSGAPITGCVGGDLSKNVTQQNIIKSIKEKKDGKEFAEKLIEQLSSYLGDNNKPKNNYSLDDVEGGKLVILFRDWLVGVRDGTNGLKLETKKPINQAYIDDLIKIIVQLAERFDKMDKDVKGNPSAKMMAEVLTQTDSMLSWYESKGKVIKDLHSTTRNWFSRYFNR